MDRYAPSEAEAAALKKSAGLRTSLVVVTVVCLAIILGGWVIPSEGARIVIVASAVMIELGVILYLALGFRCPRCANWMPPAATKKSRCVSCGMHLGDRRTLASRSVSSS